jgi:PAS domain S-box-containing protein
MGDGMVQEAKLEGPLVQAEKLGELHRVSWLQRWAWLPVPVFLTVICVLAFLRFDVIWNPPFLIPALNLFFGVGVGFFVAILAVRSYSANRSLTIQFLGCAMLAAGLGTIGNVLYFVENNMNANISILSMMLCLSMFCYLASALSGLSHGSPRRQSRWLLPASYLVILAIFFVLVILIQLHLLPVFFVNGSGDTALGKLVSWITVGVCTVAAILLMYRPKNDEANFRRWYGLGLMLVAVGFFGVSLQISTGDLINWAGRSSEYLGLTYILAAVMLPIRESGEWLLPLEKALRDSEEKYRNIVELANEGIWIIDAEARTTFVNMRMAEMLGYKPEEMAGKKSFDFMDEEMKTSSRLRLEQRSKGVKDSTEVKYVRKDGSSLWTISSSTPLCDKAGKFIGAIGMVMDITERKRTEDALAFQAQLLSEVHEAVFSSDCNYTITYWNEAAEKLFGWTKEEVLGRNSGELLKPKVEGSSRDEERSKLRSEGHWEGEVQYLRKDGTYFLVEINSTILKDANGKDMGNIIVSRDITERKRAEEALRESEDKYRNIVELANEGIWIIDAEARTTFVNMRMAEMLGYEPEEMAGKKSFDFMDEETKAASRLRLGQRSKGVKDNPEVKYVRKDGSSLWTISSSTPLYDKAGKFIGAIGMVMDISERKRAEEALRESEEKFFKAFYDNPVAITLSDENGRYVDVNEGCSRITGYSRDELIGHTSEELNIIDTEKRNQYLAELQKNVGSKKNLEFEIRTKSGDKRTIINRSERITLGSKDILITFIDDVTERKRAEWEISRLASIVSSCDDAIVGKTLDGIITSWNKGAERLYGYSAAEIVGKPVNIIVPKDGWQKQQNILERIRRGEHVEHYETVRLTKDGRMVDVSITLSPIIDADGRITGASNITRDITERKLAANALQEKQEELEVQAEELEAQSEELRVNNEELVRQIEERKRAEEAVRVNLQRVHTILSGLSAAILLVAKDEFVEFANQEFCDYFRLNDTPAELIGLGASEMIVKIRDSYLTPDEAVERIGEIVRCDKLIRGEEVALKGRTCLRDYIPIYFDGKLYGRLWVHLDITERKLAEKALLESMARVEQRSGELDAALSSTTAGVMIYDRSGKVVRMNDAALNMIGLSAGNLDMDNYDKRNEVIGHCKPDGTLLKSEDAPYYRALRGESIIGEEVLFMLKERKPICVSTAASPIRNSKGEIIGAIAIFTDITERKLAEEDRERLLKEVDGQKARLEAIIEALPVGLMMVDHNGGIVLRNEIAIKIWGGKAPTVNSTEEYDVYKAWWTDTGKPVEKEERVASRALKGETIVGRMCDIQGFDGSYSATLFSAAPVRDSMGTIIGAVVIIQDITEIRKMEKDLNEAKMQAELYLDLMGHDISNMHQIAMGQLELAQEIMDEEGGLKAEERELVETPLSTLNRSARLIANVRNLQSMRRGEFKEESIDLNDLLSNIVKEHEFMLPDGSIRFVGDGPRRVMANKLLHDVFSNLVGNAIKHSNGNGVNINIRLEDASENGKNYYKVLVDDTGPGIQSDMKDKVFNRLQRGDSKARGMGLGLYIVKSLVESYHGRVWVEDRVQGDHTQGSRFVVLLPVAET